MVSEKPSLDIVDKKDSGNEDQVKGTPSEEVTQVSSEAPETKGMNFIPKKEFEALQTSQKHESIAKYHQENNKYARNVLDIQKFNLKYNAGVVYLEIESASQDKYRAIALAAESTTARVFAFDTDKGGLYEMKDDEVKSYVLGALKHVRTQQKNVAQKDFISFLLAIILGGLGIKSLVKNAQKKFSQPFLY